MIQRCSEFTPNETLQEIPYLGFGKPFICGTTIVFAISAESIYSEPTPLLATNAKSTPMVTPVSLVDPAKSMFNHARSIGVQELSSLLESPKIDVVDGVIGETFISKVSLRVLECFGSMDTIASLLFNNHRSDQISVPPSCASKGGIIRVIRYMRRWCQTPNHCPTGELRTPPSIEEGVLTSLACRLFNLYAGADRMEKLVVEEFMGNPRFFITDGDVELIWCHYGRRLRGTAFENALIWFVLEEVMSGTHALADEVR